MKLYYIRTNGYDMLIADHGDHRHYLTECDARGFGVHPEDDDEAMQYLTDNAEELAYNSHEWEETEETVDELIDWQGTEIMAEIEVEDEDNHEEV